MNRIRVHTARRMDARMFVQFMALVFMNEIRRIASAERDLRQLSVREVLEEMETISRITYSHRFGGIHTEMNRMQRRIAEVFGLAIPQP